ncbi:sulfatase [Paenibacillus allorhizosphaerae]|uniref:Arylsulfatase n=1 Tax=Paenibacillus allorhizosphaerae TaxID=2849866 RepID=A0ABM8V9X9_9BACL|nr:sulfatase-like hydrolase/transferase [Paenibacillus allorhizosphaerae]CAG7613834.1 Arylsulfatase [Paenibacillus allorhizosphaerae]
MSKPNILIIMADQHRYDCIGAYGNRDIRTPNLDGLSRDGVIYDNSFCSSPFCTPSRYSFLTGLYPHQHLGWSNRSTIPKEINTFPGLLQKAGYRTKAVGKMHFTPTYLDVGFESMLLAEQNGDGRYEDDYHRYLREHELMDRIDLMDQVTEYRAKAPQQYWDTYGAMASDLPEAHHSTTWIGNQGLAALDEWGEQNELLMVSFIKPHHPFDPPKPWDAMYDPERLQLLPGWTEQCLPADLRMHEGFFPHAKLTEPVLRQAMAHYYGSISQIDHMVGQMIDKLKSRGLYNKTLILYTSDHGEYMGYHHMLLKSNYMYEPLVKVPLMIKYPNNEQAGERSALLVNNIDVSATILEHANVEKAKFMAGRSIGSLAGKPRTFVIGENGRGRQYMVRTDRYKLILTNDSGKSAFYDLAADPFELSNLIGDPAYEHDIRTCREHLFQTLLFDAPSPTYVDPLADRIEGDNVPSNPSIVSNLAGWIASNWQ